jgi:glycogen debranching enzyme
VPSAFSLANIKDPKARNIVEGGLYVIKTNQTADGGMVANQRWYNLSWTRDAYCGLRGLLATGHSDELKQFLLFMNNVYKTFKFIPNAVSTGSNAYALYNGNAENNPNRRLGQFSPCPEANTAPETPALLILVARDYFKATNDIQTLLEVNESLQHSMDIQLKHAVANNFKLEFSGDETELCGAVNTSFAGYDKHLGKLWSMSSIALCSASLDFYMEYLALKKQSIKSYFNSFDNKTLDLKAVSQKLNDAFEKDFWRTDLPGSPGGLYDWCRIKSDNSFPKGRITNFSLFPVYYKMKPNFPDRFETNIKTIGSYFKEPESILPLVPIVGDDRYLGHNLGYLLWSLIHINDPQRTKIYDALVNGNSKQRWGSFNEAYDASGKPNGNSLRSFETGVNIDALAKYWRLGEK